MAESAFTLHSPTVAPNSTVADQHVYDGFGCSGKNISPALTWSGAPAGAKSFALTLYDPDAPTGSGWWHWVVYNIPGSVTQLPQGSGNAGSKLPAGAAHGLNDYGVAGYGGPAPPAADQPHRYVFTLYALKTDHIDVPPGSSTALIGFMLNANKLATASFTARYGR